MINYKLFCHDTLLVLQNTRRVLILLQSFPWCSDSHKWPTKLQSTIFLDDWFVLVQGFTQDSRQILFFCKQSSSLCVDRENFMYRYGIFMFFSMSFVTVRCPKNFYSPEPLSDIMLTSTTINLAHRKSRTKLQCMPEHTKTIDQSYYNVIMNTNKYLFVFRIMYLCIPKTSNFIF